MGKVAFKMPFDELRGKLATKQSGILYEGQEQGQNLATLVGKKSATNFNKYIVAYRRKGINRFYVKSNTAVNQTTLAKRQKGAFAAAQYLWIGLTRLTLSGGSFRTSMRVYAQRYSEFMGKDYTDREYFIAMAIEAIVSSQPEITFVNYLNGEGQTVRGIANPFYSTIVYNQTYQDDIGQNYDSILLNSVTARKGLAQVIRDYKMSPVDYSSVLVDIEGVERKVILLYIEGQQAQEIAGSVGGKSVYFSRTDTNVDFRMYLFDSTTGKRIGATRYYLYLDAEYSQPVRDTTVFRMGTKLYAITTVD